MTVRLLTALAPLALAGCAPLRPGPAPGDTPTPNAGTGTGAPEAAVLDRSALPQTLAVMVAGRLASGPPAWQGQLPTLAHCAPDPRALCGQPQPTDDCVAR